MFVRPVRKSDIQDLVMLSQLGLKGMTTLPKSQADWEKRIDDSLHSFSCLPTKMEENSSYLMVLVHNNKVIGTSAIYSPIGISRPFYNYRITRFTRISPELNIRCSGQMLHLVNDYDGAAEVGTLILHPTARGSGAGKLAANARYLLIAAYRESFPSVIMAELRGVRDTATDTSPFWEALGKHFFNLPFDLADEFSAKDFRFISDLMPRIPIYVNLLPQSAQDVIGKCHHEAVPAERMLYERGFRYKNLIDIFDAGRCMDAYQDEIDIVKNARTTKIKIGTASKIAYGLVGHSLGSSFENIKIVQGTTNGHEFFVTEETLESCGLYEGLEVLMSYEGDKL